MLGVIFVRKFAFRYLIPLGHPCPSPRCFVRLPNGQVSVAPHVSWLKTRQLVRRQLQTGVGLRRERFASLAERLSRTALPDHETSYELLYHLVVNCSPYPPSGVGWKPN